MLSIAYLDGLCYSFRTTGGNEEVEFRQLRYFIAVAERLNFSRAAQDLHVTVPPLSRQIQQLEDEFGVRLFARDRRHVALTDAGRTFLDEARKLVAQSAHMTDCVRLAKCGETGLVRIGIALHLGERVGRVLTEHAKRYPGVELQCDGIFSTVQNELLAEGKIDVGFLRPPIESAHLASEMLFEERFLVLVNRDHPLARRKSLRIRDLANEPLVVADRSLSTGLYDKTMALYKCAGITPRLIPLSKESASYDEMQNVFLAARKGIFIIADEIPSRPAPGSTGVAVPLDEPDARIEVRMAWRRNESSPAVLAFLDSARQFFCGAPPQRAAHSMGTARIGLRSC